jgi:hypothetical protein
MKISYGELDVPERATTKAVLRNGFLGKVKELVPDVFKDLAREAMPIYSRLKAEYPAEYFEKDIEWLAVPPESSKRTSPIYGRHPTLIDLIERLDAWAQKWNLVACEPNDPWVLRVALAHWSFGPVRGGKANISL